jgi:hypothetical protein
LLKFDAAWKVISDLIRQREIKEITRLIDMPAITKIISVTCNEKPAPVMR